MTQSRFRLGISSVAIACLVLCGAGGAWAQSLEIVNDKDVPVSGIQEVNVGEHVRLRVRAQPLGTTFTNPSWIVTGFHIKDWITKDSEPVYPALSDYLGETIHLTWKDTSLSGMPNVVHVRAIVGSSLLTTQAQFRVVRAPKAEKFYSEDLLMENHANWHSVYNFSAASTRRGDLFLTWHRSQIEYFNNWRSFFGYPPIAAWVPTTPWAAGTPIPAKQHPSSTAPQPAFSSRHDLITLVLTDEGLHTASAGEYDLVTLAQSRGTTSQFVSAGYTLRTETVRQILCEDPGFPCSSPAVARNGVATLPTWWMPDTGQTNQDPWYQAGCPARADPDPNLPFIQTCTPQSKVSASDYNLRELGESIESGEYATDFRVNYHALAHLAASGDMSNPATSMRDSIFWGWHAFIDSILDNWQSSQGTVEALGPVMLYSLPSFSSDWANLRVAFSKRLVADLVRPANVTVNGAPATSVTDVSFTGTGFIFEFSGFPIPPDGTVVVIVRREINNTFRTTLSQPQPTPTLLISTFGNLLTPAVNRINYSKP